MSSPNHRALKISVVIPCYKVRNSILGIISQITEDISKIYVVDDYCPEQSGRHVELLCKDQRVSIIYNEVNLGVGGAVKRGYQEALNDKCDIIVKLDGDGQMAPSLIPKLIDPLLNGVADYSKGNRFYYLEDLTAMPALRIFGNSVLSLISKLSTGYWLIFDPTNGFTAVTRTTLESLPLKKIDSRFFFESDMLFRLNLINAAVIDIPMKAVYGDEVSNLSPIKSIPIFLYKHIINFMKRVFYNYYLRNMSIASLELPLGILLFSFGAIYGLIILIRNSETHNAASPGTVMLVGLTILVGIQFLLSFISYDIHTAPQTRHTSTKNK